MGNVGDGDRDTFFKDVDAACRVRDGEPRVRLVHPTWEGETLWFATDPGSPKTVQMSQTPVVDLQDVRQRG